MLQFRTFFSLFLVLVAGLPLARAEPTTEPLQITLIAQKILIDDQGIETFGTADRAEPGDIVAYAATYHNVSSRPLSGVNGMLPIPEGMELIPGSIAPADFEASLDGVSFAPAPLQRTVRLANGTLEKRPVPYRDYRALRWKMGDLSPSSKQTVNARVRIVTTVTP
ncbi:MAG: hypothetical protein C0621_01530 [Desulfuromonas sp.]|nr:MAG: hypothetical protein C0621_01530 [Desulfuromonas sp.]